MRKFKIFLWIFIIFLIQTVILARVHFMGAVLSLVLPYTVCVMLLEEEFSVAAAIGLICAAAAGALCGRSFYVTVPYIFICSLIVFALKNKPRYIKSFIKALFLTFIISGAQETLFFALRNMTVTYDMLLYDALPTAAINTVFVLILYPLLKRTMYKEEKKKLLIGDLV